MTASSILCGQLLMTWLCTLWPEAIVVMGSRTRGCGSNYQLFSTGLYLWCARIVGVGLPAAHFHCHNGKRSCIDYTSICADNSLSTLSYLLLFILIIELSNEFILITNSLMQFILAMFCNIAMVYIRYF